MKFMIRACVVSAVFAAVASSAFAHISLQQASAEASRPYEAVMHIGHGCDAEPTTSVAVQIPKGFDGAKPLPKPGWNVTVRDGAASWTAATREAALPNGQQGEFILVGTAPSTTGPLWFKVLQTCQQGSRDWSQVPAEGTSTKGMKLPAVLLQVVSPGELAKAPQLPKIEGAWVRGAVPGQQGTGAFMKLTAKEPMQFVGLSTPVAGVAEIHEMKMEGDVMRMRAIAKLDLPAGRTVELKPGGYHLMLMDLKQPLPQGSSVPMSLVFRDSKGVDSRLELNVPVRVAAPAGGAAAPADAHKH